MANSKTGSLKKELAAGRYAKSSHERVRAESTHAFLETLVGDFLVQEKRVVMQAAGKYCDLLRPTTSIEGHLDFALISSGSFARRARD